jgi:hypothetical protein
MDIAQADLEHGRRLEKSLKTLAGGRPKKSKRMREVISTTPQEEGFIRHFARTNKSGKPQ